MVMRNFFLVGLICFSIINAACNKGDYSQSSSAKLRIVIKTYLDEQKKANANNARFIDTLMQSANWSGLTSGYINSMESFGFLPVTFNSNATGLVFIIESRNNNIEEGYLLEIKDSSGKPNPQEVIANFYGYKNLGFSGSMTRFSFANTFTWEMGYKNGINIYDKRIKHSNYPPPSLHLSSEDAGKIYQWLTVWNPITTYYLVTYYVDGSQDWEYLTGPCKSNCVVTQQITKGARNIVINCDGNFREDEVKPIYNSKP
jgi:hypothetical protein